MAVALRSDKELREALNAFFSLISADVQPPGTSFDDVLFQVGGRFAYDVCFIESASAADARHRAIERLMKMLGPVSSDEKESDDLLWRTAAERARMTTSTSVNQAVAKVLGDFETMAIEPRKFIGQNHAIKFTGATTDLRIGPVRAIKTNILETEFQGAYDGVPWARSVSTPIYKDGRLSDERIKPDLVWEVDLVASIKNIKEQAVWMVNVALGLIRLAQTQQPFYHPSNIGIQEADPFGEAKPKAVGIVLSEKGMSSIGGGGSKVLLDDQTSNTLTSKPFSDYEIVFDAKKGSVAERVAQGLGWMTRGRQSPDRAERLLYFFTAMEALLTNDDKTAPVTQTIARHASVILADNPEDRASTAGKIKVLYAARSALVHAGKRTVSKRDADTTQDIVEALYSQIIVKVDPSSHFEKLNTALAKASYGGVWPSRSEVCACRP